MKEATGELNTTVIVVIIVAMLVAFFYFTIWPVIKNNMNQNSACAKAICPKENRSSDGKTVDCYTVDKSGNKSETFKCVWKG